MKTTLTLLAAGALIAGCQSVSNRTLGTTAGGAIIGAGVGMMAGGDDKRNAALGAVVGSIRQEQSITITPAGGKNVSVLFPDGPQLFDTLEAGATAASQFCDRLARDKARQAGSVDVRITHDRQDTIVNNGDQSVFFESQVSAIAVGRPSGMA